LPLQTEPKTYIIGCEDDLELLDEYAKFGWKDLVYSAEFILMGVLKQELEFEEYRLTVQHHRPAARRTRRKA
jgi:hypothetical protein